MVVSLADGGHAGLVQLERWFAHSQLAGCVCVGGGGLFWAFPTRLLHHRQKSLTAGARADSFLISVCGPDPSHVSVC